ncbi:MAG: tetratricopeptide repeat protein [Deltaproteobacteria bacterium]|nr:tetratricopeptide repeat protein [Deltaproteobacteria bacterium]
MPDQPPELPKPVPATVVMPRRTPSSPVVLRAHEDLPGPHDREAEVKQISEVTSVFGFNVPFVGRRGEIEVAYNAVREAINHRHAKVIWVYGPHGVGKSRLIAELARLITTSSKSLKWVKVTQRETSGPATLPGRVLAEVLGGLGALRQPKAWDHIQSELQSWLGQERAPGVIDVVAPLLGLRPDGVSEDRTMVEPPLHVSAQLVAALLRHRAKSAPLVLQFDAASSAADELPAMLTGLQTNAAQSAVVAIVEARVAPPEGFDLIPVSLGPMDAATLRALAGKLLHSVRGAPQNVGEALASQAAGSPERLVDMLRGMVAAGEIAQKDGVWRWVSRTERGTSVSWQNTLAASGQSTSTLPDRIARLPEELRLVVDAAAVFGPTCWFGGVLSVLRGAHNNPADSISERDRSQLRAAMLQLQAVDVVVFVEQSHLGSELEFSFVHSTDPAAVVREMDAEKRDLFSRLAAQWLSSRPRVDPIAENAHIAELFEAGGRRRQAALFYLEAGNAARSVGQLQRALALYEAGTRNSGADDADVACDLRTAYGGGLLRLSRHVEAERALLDALHMARCLDDDLRCGTVQLRVAQVARVSGHYDAALAYLDAAMKHLKVAGAHRWIADVSDELGLIHLIRGESDAYKTALQHFLKALALRRRSQDRRVVARSLCNIARVHLGRGHFSDAHDAVVEAVQICDQIQERWGAAEARAVLGEVHAAQGKYKLAFQAWEQASMLAQEVGDRRRRLEVALARAETAIALGEWQEGAAMMIDMTELARDVDDPELLSGVYRVQASISLERSALETADLDSERAVDVARGSGARLAVARALVVRACVLGTRALSDAGTRATIIDRKCTEAFDESLQMLHDMGDLVRMATGLRSYLAYLSQRGGGPRLAAVQQRLAEIEQELSEVAG